MGDGYSRLIGILIAAMTTPTEEGTALSPNLLAAPMFGWRRRRRGGWRRRLRSRWITASVLGWRCRWRRGRRRCSGWWGGGFGAGFRLDLGVLMPAIAAATGQQQGRCAGDDAEKQEWTHGDLRVGGMGTAGQRGGGSPLPTKERRHPRRCFRYSGCARSGRSRGRLDSGRGHDGGAGGADAPSLISFRSHHQA